MSEKVDIYMPIYIGDYMSDTSELAAEEHGAYLLLLMAAWKRGGRLPIEPDRLCRLAAVPEKRWLKVWGMIARFFTLEGDAFVQARLTKELAKASSRRASASANGRASAEARRVQRDVERTGNEEANGKSTGVGTGVPAGGATNQPADGQRKSNSSKSGSLSLSDSAALGADQTHTGSDDRAKPLTGYSLQQTFARIRSEVVGGMEWQSVNVAGGKASTMAELVEQAGARADVEPTIRMLFADAKAGKAGNKSAEILRDGSFAFGAWCSQWTALRERLHSKAPAIPVAAARASGGAEPAYRKL